jgi:hypothetical protein
MSANKLRCTLLVLELSARKSLIASVVMRRNANSGRFGRLLPSFLEEKKKEEKKEESIKPSEPSVSDDRLTKKGPQ